jgi:hypothetical protein
LKTSADSSIKSSTTPPSKKASASSSKEEKPFFAPAMKPTVSQKPNNQREKEKGATSSEIVDISKGFILSDKLKAEIDAEKDNGLNVRIKAGTLIQEGTIKIYKDKNDQYSDKKDAYFDLDNDLLRSLGGGYLKISITKSQVSGYATITNKGGDTKEWLSKLKKQPAMIGMGVKIGNSEPSITNKFENGVLSLGVTNLGITLGGFFKLGLDIQFANMKTVVFEGSADMAIKGANGRVSVNNKTGKLSGEGSLAITGFSGFSGEVKVKYDSETGAIDIHGKASYTGQKLSGSIELVATDLKSANNFAKDAIAAAGGKNNAQEAKPPSVVPPTQKDGERALAGVGQLAFNLTKWFAGTVNVIVDGKGNVTVIGKIAPPAEIELFKQKDWDKQIFSFQVEAGYGIPVIGTIGIYAAVSLNAIAKLGPAKLYNIEILGTYSTDPEVQKSIQISASLNISAYAGLRLRAEGGAKLTLVAHDLKIGVGVNADIGVKAYADARPTIGYRDPGEFYISGTLDMVAQPVLGLSGDFFIKLDSPFWSPLGDETWTWPIGSKEWPLADPIGLSAEVKNYVLGSGKVPEIEFKKPEFDGSKFMTDMVDKKLPEKSGGGKPGQGGFKEDGSVSKPPADLSPKKGTSNKSSSKPNVKGKGGKKNAANGKKVEKGKQDDLQLLRGELESLRASALTRKELDKKLNKIQKKLKSVTFNVVEQSGKYIITSNVNGKKGKTVMVEVKESKSIKDRIKDKFKSWWKVKKDFTDKAGKKHKVYFTGESGQAMVASTPKTLRQVVDENKSSSDGKKKTAATSADSIVTKIDNIKNELKGLKEDNPDYKTKSEELQTEIDKVVQYLKDLVGVKGEIKVGPYKSTMMTGRTGDHIPSFGAIAQALKNEGGSQLSLEQARIIASAKNVTEIRKAPGLGSNLEGSTIAVFYDSSIHKRSSRTFGSKNRTLIPGDSINLRAAASADFNAIRVELQTAVVDGVYEKKDIDTAESQTDIQNAVLLPSLGLKY